MTDTTTGVADIKLGSDYLEDPYEIYARLREEGPVQPVIMPTGMRAWLVTRYADARAALADPRLAKDAHRIRDLFERHVNQPAGFSRDIAEHMLNTDPPDHERLRKLVTKAFTARRVEQLRPRISEITEALLDDMAGQDEVDLLEAFAFPLPITVICELLGVPERDRADFRSWSNALFVVGDPERTGAASRSLAQYLVELVVAKRANPGDDLLSSLIEVRDAGDQLTGTELVSMAFLLLVAGHETTVNLIGNGMLALLRHPDQLALLRSDRSLLPNAVEEFLRYDGPVNHATLRFTAQPVELGGVLIPEGEFVMVALSSANRDVDRYGEPDRLDITRDTGGHLAFGHGIHYCLGAPLARLEGQIAFAALLERFPHIELAVDPDELRWRSASIVRGLHRLPLRLGR